MLDLNKFPTAEQEIEWIEEALVTLLREIARRDKARQKPSKYGFVAFDINKLGSRSSLYWDVRKVIDEPIREAAALTLRTLGERLHEMAADMEAVHDRVILHTRTRRNYWSMLLDKHWDGIGDWHA